MISNRRLISIGLIVLIVVVAVVVALIKGGGNSTQTVNQSTTTVNQEEASISDANVVVTPTGLQGALGSGASTSSSWYHLYFTAPIYPDNPANHHGGVDTHLVDLMNKATKTMDVADYNFDLFDVADAMAAAKKRGVMVRFVTDTDTINDKSANVQKALGILKSAKIPIVQDERSPIMHDKFTVIDGRWVETGSWNYTDGSTYHDNNNMIIIDSPELAANYTTVFNEMFEAHEFSSVGKIPHPSLTIDGTPVQNCFSPHGGCTDLAVKAIDTAQKSIDFMAFSFTSNPIGKAMLDRSKAGVDVQGVFETTGSNTVYSEYKKMQRAGLEVYTDGNPWNLHHKVIIIDDRTVIFGSFNFSSSAENDNNENMLVIDDPNLAKAFLTEYARVLYVAQHPAYKK